LTTEGVGEEAEKRGPVDGRLEEQEEEVEKQLRSQQWSLHVRQSAKVELDQHEVESEMGVSLTMVRLLNSRSLEPVVLPIAQSLPPRALLPEQSACPMADSWRSAAAFLMRDSSFWAAERRERET
jgi:hypothetical protein